MRLRVYNKLIILCVTICILTACKDKSVKPTDEEGIKEAIVKFDKALIETYRKLNTEPLNNIASDKEIGKNHAIILGFIRNGIYMESEFDDIKFLEFKSVSKGNVDAIVWEKWHWRHLNSKDKKVVKSWIDEEYKILYHMHKDKKRGWIVESVKLE